jgi:hypothetical protein
MLGLSWPWLIVYICSVVVLILATYSTETDVQAGLLTVDQAIQANVLMMLFIVGLGICVAAVIHHRVIGRSLQDKTLITFLVMTASLAGFGGLNMEEGVRLNESIPLGAIRAHYFRDYFIVQWLFVTSPVSGFSLAFTMYFSSKQSPN